MPDSGGVVKEFVEAMLGQNPDVEPAVNDVIQRFRWSIKNGRLILPIEHDAIPVKVESMTQAKSQAEQVNVNGHNDVFVIHGRDTKLTTSVYSSLRSLLRWAGGPSKRARRR
jgi:hypothetical protein